MPRRLRWIPRTDRHMFRWPISVRSPCRANSCWPRQPEVKTTNSLQLLRLGVSLSCAGMVACTTGTAGVQPSATNPARIQVTSVLPTVTPLPATATPEVGFTPESTQRNEAGVPLPFAPGARSVVVTYTPAPAGGTVIKSGYAMVSVGDNYFYPDTLTVTVGSTIEWRYDGGAGETESTHNVVALDSSFNSGDLFAGTRWAFSFQKPGEFAYVCTYHAKQQTGKIVVVVQ